MVDAQIYTTFAESNLSIYTKTFKMSITVIQWVRRQAPNAGGPGFDPWSGN